MHNEISILKLPQSIFWRLGPVAFFGPSTQPNQERVDHLVSLFGHNVNLHSNNLPGNPAVLPLPKHTAAACGALYHRLTATEFEVVLESLPAAAEYIVGEKFDLGKYGRRHAIDPHAGFPRW
jgi:hypothetical protein